MADNRPFRTDIGGGIAELIFDNPPVNAFGTAAQFAIADEINRLGADPAVRVIVITAEGKGFTAGLDMKEMSEHPERIVDANHSNHDTFEAIPSKIPNL